MAEHRPGIERAYDKIVILRGRDQADFWRKLLSVIQPCDHSSSLFRRIAQAADNDQLADCLVEGMFVFHFLDHGFAVSIIPGSSKERRPDLRVSRDGQTAVVEIKHYRHKHPGPPLLDLDEYRRTGKTPLLAKYGDYERDEKRCHRILVNTLEQIFAHIDGKEPFIIAFWNSDDDLDELQFSSSVQSLLARERNILPPDSCGFSLFRSNWIEFPNGRRIQQFYATPLTPMIPGTIAKWMDDLEVGCYQI